MSPLFSLESFLYVVHSPFGQNQTKPQSSTFQTFANSQVFFLPCFPGGILTKSSFHELVEFPLVSQDNVDCRTLSAGLTACACRSIREKKKGELLTTSCLSLSLVDLHFSLKLTSMVSPSLFVFWLSLLFHRRL